MHSSLTQQFALAVAFSALGLSLPTGQTFAESRAGATTQPSSESITVGGTFVAQVRSPRPSSAVSGDQDQENRSEQVGLEEIVVTARRREESLMEIPMAITAFTSKDIDSRSLARLEDVSDFAPGLFVSQAFRSGGFSRARRRITFRGFSLSSGLVFVDGAPLSISSNPEFVDLERIEVLKGPQSAYFGRSTFSGALNFITREPAAEFGGRVSTEVGSHEQMDALVSIEGPLIDDRLSARVTAHRRVSGGEYDNFADPGQVFGRETTDSFSLMTLFTPTDRLTLKSYVTYVATDDGPPAKMALKPPDMNCDLGGSSGPWFCGELPNADEIPASYISGNYLNTAFAREVLLENSNNFPTIFDPHYLEHGGLRKDAIAANLRVDYELGSGYALSSLTAYGREKRQGIRDITHRDGRPHPNPNPAAATNPDLLPYPWWHFLSQNRQNDFSQELRLSSPQDRRLRWLLGVSYVDLETPPGSGLYGISPLGIIAVASSSTTRSKTPAVFGGMYFDFTPQLTLSAEFRYQRDEITQQAISNSSGRLIPGGGPVLKNTWTNVTPRVSLDYQYSDASMVYGLWSRGFRPGGFNASLSGSAQSVLDQLAQFGANINYDEEQLDNYEIGLKSTWFDQRLRTRLSVYYEEWTKGQVSNSIVFTTPEGGVNLFGVVQNLGSVNMSGVELEAEYRVGQNLRLSGSFGYADSEIREIGVCADCAQILGTTEAPGNQLAQSPQYTGSLSGEYAAPLTDRYEWFGRVDSSYRGDSYVTVANSAILPARTLVNLRVGLRSDKLSLEAFVKNLTDSSEFEGVARGPEVLFTIASGQEIRAILPRKRQFGIRVSYDF